MNLPKFIFSGVLIAILGIGCQESSVELPSETSIFFYPKVGTEKEHEYCALRDGGYAVSGNIEEAAYLFVINEDGSERFYSTINGEAYDEFRYVFETADGHLVAVGSTTSADLGSNGRYCTLVVKFDKMGNVVWQHVYAKDYHTLANNAIELEDGSIILMGEFQNPQDGRSDIIIVKITSEGTEEWEHHYALAEGGHSVWGSAIGTNGELVVSSQTAPIFQPYFFGRFALSLLSIDPVNGDSLWSVTYGHYLKEDDNARYGQLRQPIISLSDGYVIGQNYENDSNELSAQLMKVDLVGNEIWETKLTANEGLSFEGLHQTKDGGFLVSGSSEGKAVVVKTDHQGKQEWISLTGGDTKAQSAFHAYDTDDKIYVLGRLWTPGSGVGQYMMYKLDYDGEIIKD